MSDAKKAATKDTLGNIVLAPVQVPPEQPTLCDLCGYANPAHTTVCKKCNNYLSVMRVIERRRAYD